MGNLISERDVMEKSQEKFKGLRYSIGENAEDLLGKFGKYMTTILNDGGGGVIILKIWANIDVLVDQIKQEIGKITPRVQDSEYKISSKRRNGDIGEIEIDVEPVPWGFEAYAAADGNIYTPETGDHATDENQMDFQFENTEPKMNIKMKPTVEMGELETHSDCELGDIKQEKTDKNTGAPPSDIKEIIDDCVNDLRDIKAKLGISNRCDQAEKMDTKKITSDVEKCIISVSEEETTDLLLNHSKSLSDYLSDAENRPILQRKFSSLTGDVDHRESDSEYVLPQLDGMYDEKIIQTEELDSDNATNDTPQVTTFCEFKRDFLRQGNVEGYVDAAIVCKKRTYKWKNGTEICVSLCDEESSGNDDDDEIKRTVLLEAPSDLHKDDLEIFLEDEGEIEKIDMSNADPGIAKIIFKSTDVAAKLVIKGEVMVDETSVKVRKYETQTASSQEQSSSSDYDAKTLYISCVDPSWSKRAITKYFEKKGGEIVNINFDDLEQNGQVMVQYKEIRAIERLSQETLSYRGKTMLISRPSNSEPRKIEDENTHTLRVENIPTTKTKKFVRLFFQNKNKSGGGPIKDLDYEAKGEAIIVFKDVSDAADVLSKPSLTIEGQEIQITRLDDSYSTDKTCAILISGDIAQIDRDTLDLHFEEQGGGIEESYISEDKSTAVITYEKQEFAEIVLQKRHKVEGIALHVQKIFPALPPPLITPPVEERILLLREVSSATSEEIKRYIEPVADCNIQKIAFSCTHKGTILLEFDKEPDFNQIRSKTIKKPFKDKMINVGFIPKSSSIQIHNIDDSNDQYLQMLIQNIDGNKVEDIVIYEEPLRYALAHIPNTDLCQLIDKLTKKKKKMIYRKFHESFGVEPLAETQNTPSSWYTNDLEVKIDETEKLKPFLENELSKVLLNKSLQKENMQIRWPPSPEGEVFLCRSASQHDPQPAENWDTCAKEILAKELDRFETVTVVIKKELWQEFKGHLDDIIKENSDSVVISPNEENLSVGIFGAHEDVSLTEQQLRPYQAADESRPTDIRSLLLEGVNSSIHPDILLIHLADLVREDSTIESIDITRQLDTGKVIVTYTNPQDAQQLLSLHEIHIDGNPIYITPHIIDTKLTTDTVTNARKQDMFLDEETRQRTVIIEGINPTWTDDVIEKFFKQPKIGGGEIESLAKEKHDNTAVMISYKESSNAKNILEHRKFDYAGQSLYTRPHQLPEPVFTLEVTGIPKKTTKDFIELYFENKRESGGGNIRRMSYKTGDSKATVTFEDCKDAMEVLQKMDHWLEIGDEKYLLTILALDVTYTTNKICAIRVSKFTDKINQKYLKVYFGNRRKSGGGKIKEIYFDEENKYAVITFESPDVIKRIIQKRNHCLENELLKVTVLDTAPFPTAIHTPCESVALILNHVTPSITSQILTTYFKEATDCDIKEIRYSWEHQGVVELLFEAIPEFEKVRDHIQQKPILGRMCSIQKVPKPRSLQIYNIGKLSEDYMDGFLGKDDLAGELLVRAKVYAKPTAHCIADFRVGTDLPLIIKEINKEHGEMQVFPYNTSFGLVPPKTSLRGPDTWFPKQVELEQPSKNIAEFLSKNTTQQNLLEQLIKSKNGKLTWPTLIHEKINVSYEPNAFESADKTWATDIETAIQGFLHNFTEERINILHQIWPSFKQQIKKCDTDYIKCILDDETNSLICIGTIDEVRKVKRIAQEKKGKLEEELRKQNSITTDIITLNKYQVFLLEANDFSRKMDSVAKSTDISLNVDECKVKIKGVPGNIDEVKLEMHKMIATIVDKKLTISSALVKIASRSNATKYINNLIQQCGVKLYWIVEHDAIVLYAMSNGELSKGENLFSEHLDEKTLTLNSAHAKVLKSDKGKLFIKEQNEKSDDRVELSISASAITLRGTSDKVYTLYEDIDAFIKEHAKIEKFFEVPLVGVVRYLYQSIDNIKKEFEDESVPVIEQKLDGTKPGFLIKGTFKTCKKAEDILRKRTKNIKAIEIPTNQQGIVEYFTLKDGRDILAGKELRYKVAIEAAKDTNVPLLGGGEAGEKDSPIEKTSVEYSGVKLVVAQADLPTYKCDAIVNAANEKMEHYGGLAAAIVKRGGKEIQEECSNYVRNYGQLISPDVYVSSAGKLFCKNIIHAVGPRWNAGRDGEENKLFEVIYELLTKAKEKNFRTIAIPAISTGIFRFPMALALATILDAIKEFCDKEGAAGNLKEIHLVDFTDDIANAMKEAVHKKFGVPRVKERKRLMVSGGSICEYFSRQLDGMCYEEKIPAEKIIKEYIYNASVASVGSCNSNEGYPERKVQVPHIEFTKEFQYVRIQITKTNQWERIMTNELGGKEDRDMYNTEECISMVPDTHFKTTQVVSKVRTLIPIAFPITYQFGFTVTTEPGCLVIVL